jgi:hypothetical protein
MLGYFLLPAGGGYSVVFTGDVSAANADPYQIHWFLYKTAAQSLAGIRALFTVVDYGDWRFWLFLYLSLAVSAHMELSPPDLKQMWGGLWIIILMIFIFNMIYLLLFSEFDNLILKSLFVFELLNRLLMTGLVFSLINFLFTWVVAAVFGLITSGKVPNPATR